MIKSAKRETDKHTHGQAETDREEGKRRCGQEMDIHDRVYDVRGRQRYGRDLDIRVHFGIISVVE